MEILLLLFALFFGIGFFGFGSGFAMLTLIFQVVSDYGFLTAEEYSRMVVISQSLPGPVSINAISYNGFIVAGVPGMVVSVFAMILPSLIIISIILKYLDRFRSSEALGAVFLGIKPVVIGLVGAAAVMISENTLYLGNLISTAWVELGFSYLNIVSCIIFAIVLVLLISTKISPFILILLSALAGAFFIR
jgi:Chromate transport protein ChrA